MGVTKNIAPTFTQLLSEQDSVRIRI